MIKYAVDALHLHLQGGKYGVHNFYVKREKARRGYCAFVHLIQEKIPEIREGLGRLIKVVVESDRGDVNLDLSQFSFPMCSLLRIILKEEEKQMSVSFSSSFHAILSISIIVSHGKSNHLC